MAQVLARFKADVAAWKKLVRADAAAQAKAFLREAGALDAEKAWRGETPTLTFLEPA